MAFKVYKVLYNGVQVRYVIYVGQIKNFLGKPLSLVSDISCYHVSMRRCLFNRGHLKLPVW